MKRKTAIAIITAFILGSFTTAAYSSSQAIKQRMIERLPVIKTLKDQGIVGENNKGFLEFIGPKKEKEDVVKAENSDRRSVYEAIATQQGTTAAVVGELRAAQIANKALPGQWLQNANGDWYQK